MSKVTAEMATLFEKRFVENYNRAYSPQRIIIGLEALFDANLISLPVDTDKVREDVVREAAEWLQKQGLYAHAASLAEALLPTKDRAQELVDEFWLWAKETDENGFRNGSKESGGWVDTFARWLIAREKVNG